MKLNLGLNKCTNEQYHADREFYSSSTLKLLIKNKVEFYNQYILNKPAPPMPDSPSLAFGSYMHTMILEPHLLGTEYQALPPNILSRRGQAYENFKRMYADKTLLTQSQVALGEKLYDKFRQHPKAPGLIKGGKSEESLCVELDGVPIKVRADYINVRSGYIVDIKTTSDATDKQSIIRTNEKWDYVLSAALYCMAFSEHYGKKFDFYWIYLSKYHATCDVYKMSLGTMKKGIEKVEDALTILKKNRENDSWLEYEIEEV